MKKILLGLLVSGAWSSTFAAHYDIKFYNYTKYTLNLEQGEKEQWNDAGGLDTEGPRKISPNSETTLHLYDNCGFNQSKDYFKLRVRNLSASTKIPVYKNLLFGILHETTFGSCASHALIGDNYKSHMWSPILGGELSKLTIEVYENKIKVTTDLNEERMYLIKELPTPEGPSFDQPHALVNDWFSGSEKDQLDKYTGSALSKNVDDLVFKNTGKFSVKNAGQMKVDLTFYDLQTGVTLTSTSRTYDVAPDMVTNTADKPTCDAKSSSVFSGKSLQSTNVRTTADLNRFAIHEFPNSFLRNSNLFFNSFGESFNKNVINSTSELNMQDANIEFPENFLLSDVVRAYPNDDVTTKLDIDKVVLGSTDLENSTVMTQSMSSIEISNSISQASTSTETSGWSIGGSPGGEKGKTLTDLFSLNKISLSITFSFSTSNTDSCTHTATTTYTMKSQTVNVPPHTGVHVTAMMMIGEISGSFTVEQKASSGLRLKSPYLFKLPQSSLNGSVF